MGCELMYINRIINILMSLRDRTISGFKFSFKRQQSSSHSTPKFTSIQLPPQSLSAQSQAQISQKQPTPTVSYKPMKRKSPRNINQSDIKKQQRLKIKQWNKKINSNNLLELLKQSEQEKQEKGKEFYHEREKIREVSVRVHDGYEEISMSLRKAKIAETVAEGKVEGKSGEKRVVLSKQRKIYFKKNKSLERLFKDPLPSPSAKRQERQVEDEEQKESSSYLQIFKKRKNQEQHNSSSKLSQLNLSLISLKSTQQPIKQSHSPLLSQISTPKIKPTFLTKQTDLQQLIDMSSFPSTQKSIRFNEEYGSGNKINHFFRKVDKKGNSGGNSGGHNVSKALFKSQKTNVNLRLNNIGGAMSKLNIHID